MKRFWSILTAGVAVIACTSRDFTGVPIFITSVSPTSGPTTGGTLVVVRGTGLPFNANVLTARFDNVDAPSFTIIGDTLATVTTPPHPAGLVSFTVILKTGDSLFVPAAFTYTGSAPSGNPTITSLTRDAGSSAGGAVLVVNGTGFSSGVSVTFGGLASPNVVVTSPTQLTVTAPAHAVGKVDVAVVGTTTAMLPNAFEYLPAPTATWFNSDFEDGTLGKLSPNLSPGGALATSTDVAFAGTHSAKGSSTVTPGGGAGVTFQFGNQGSPPNPAVSEANGVYVRWYLYIPTATVNAVQSPGRQIKVHLFRRALGSGVPGWLMCGVGTDFRGPPLTCFIDNGIFNIPGGETNFLFGDGVWAELQTWNKRLTGGVGRSRMWLNGKEIFDITHAAQGNDDPNDPYMVFLGLVYVQSPALPVVAYIDNATSANGYIDP